MGQRVGCVFVMLSLIASVLMAGGQKEAPQKRTLIHYHYTDVGEMETLTRGHLTQFMAENPGVDVQLVMNKDDELLVRIRTTLAAGAQLDTCFLGSNQTAEFFAMKGVLREIIPESFGVKSVQEVVDMWNPGAFQAAGGVWEGKYYGLPQQASNHIAWINTRFMREAGLNPESGIPKTWDDFVTAARRMTMDEGGVRKRNGFGVNAKSTIFPFCILAALATQQNLDWSTERGFYESLDNPNLGKAMKTFTDFALKDKIWDPALVDDDRMGFANGLLATFMTGGTWYWGFLNDFPDTRTDARPFAFPRYVGGRDAGGITYGNNWVVTKNSPDPKLAFKFANHMLSYPNDWIKLGVIQPRRTLDLTLGETFIPRLSVFTTEMQTPSPFGPNSTKHAELMDYTGAAVQRVLFEGVSIEASIKQLKADVARILSLN